MAAARAPASRPTWLLLPALLVSLSLFFAILMIARFSLNTWSASTGMVSDWTLANYKTFFADSFNYRILETTFRISLLVEEAKVPEAVRGLHAELVSEGEPVE